MEHPPQPTQVFNSTGIVNSQQGNNNTTNNNGNQQSSTGAGAINLVNYASPPPPTQIEHLALVFTNKNQFHENIVFLNDFGEMKKQNKVMSGVADFREIEYPIALYQKISIPRWHVFQMNIPEIDAFYSTMAKRFAPDLIILLTRTENIQADIEIFCQTTIEKHTQSLITVPNDINSNIECQCNPVRDSFQLTKELKTCPNGLFKIARSKEAKLMVVNCKHQDHSSCFLNGLLEYGPLAQETSGKLGVNFEVRIKEDITNTDAEKLTKALGHLIQGRDAIIHFVRKSNSTAIGFLASPSVYWNLLMKIGKELKNDGDDFSATIQSIHLKRSIMESGSVIENKSPKELIMENNLIESLHHAEHYLLIEKLVDVFSPTTTRLLCKQFYENWLQGQDSILVRKIPSNMALRKIVPLWRKQPHRRTIRLIDCVQMTDKGLAAVAQIPQITSLSLHHCPLITEAGLACLSSLTNLHHLSISGGSKLTHGAEMISSVATLESTEVKNQFYFTSATIQKLTNLSQLSRLNIIYCPYFGDDGINSLTLMKHLTHFGFARDNTVSSDGIAKIGNLTTLKVLDLMEVKSLSSECIPHWSKLTNLNELHLCSCDSLTDEGIKSLASFTRLAYLNVSNCQNVSAEAIVSYLPNLIGLSLQDCLQVTDQFLDQLVGIHHMTYLNLSGCYQVSDERIRLIKEKMKGRLEIQRDYVYSIQKPSSLYTTYFRKLFPRIAEHNALPTVKNASETKIAEEHNSPPNVVKNATFAYQRMEISETALFEQLHLSATIRPKIQYKLLYSNPLKAYDRFKAGTFGLFNALRPIQISLVMAVDLISSIEPTDPKSWHYINNQTLNDYQNAIFKFGSILTDELGTMTLLGDLSTKLEMYGLGAKTESTVHPYLPFAKNATVSEILDAYKLMVPRHISKGPRLFGPFLEMCVDSAIKSEHEDSNTYYVAVIFTEGLNNDEQKTIEMIFRARSKPLAVMFVGVGNANLEKLESLAAKLNNVQFIPFYMHSSYAALSAIAEDLLKQVAEYYSNLYLRLK